MAGETVTYWLLIALGWIGFGTFGIGVLGGLMVSAEITPSVFHESEAIPQCGFGALIAAVAFGLAQISQSASDRRALGGW
jgi:hypothetical protein